MSARNDVTKLTDNKSRRSEDGFQFGLGSKVWSLRLHSQGRALSMSCIENHFRERRFRHANPLPSPPVVAACPNQLA